MINLLLIYDEEHTKSHFIHIKRLGGLLNTCKTSFYKDKQFCPYCNKVVKMIYILKNIYLKLITIQKITVILNYQKKEIKWDFTIIRIY